MTLLRPTTTGASGAIKAIFTGTPTTDQERLAASLKRLRTTGTLEYTGEFGAEITTFIPFVHWLKAEGLLEGRRIVTYGGMRPYYYFLGDDEYSEKGEARHWLRTKDRIWPTNSTYTATKQHWHEPPDYRARYAAQGRTFDRPVLFIQNKFTVEWDTGPINYLPLNVLETLFEMAADRFDVIYSRPRTMPPAVGYTADRNAGCDYPDADLARRYKDVLILEDFCAETGAPYNLTKLEILAKSHLFVTVQGGGAHLLACFGNSLMLLFHAEGEEYPHAYASGPYKYLSNPAPTLLLARDRAQLVKGVDLIGSVQLKAGVPKVARKFHPTLEALRI